MPDCKESHRIRSITTECLTTPVEDILAAIFAIGLLQSSTAILRETQATEQRVSNLSMWFQNSAWASYYRGKPHTQSLFQQVRDRVWEFTVLNSFQVMLILLVWKSCPENQWQKFFTPSPPSLTEAGKVGKNGLKKQKVTGYLWSS